MATAVWASGSRNSHPTACELSRLARVIDHDRHPQRATWQASFDQELALEQLIVFAVPLAVRRQIPAIDLTPVIDVTSGSDGVVHMTVDRLDHL
jgi:hypothetical protein